MEYNQINYIPPTPSAKGAEEGSKMASDPPLMSTPTPVYILQEEKEI